MARHFQEKQLYFDWYEASKPTLSPTRDLLTTKLLFSDLQDGDSSAKSLEDDATTTTPDQTSLTTSVTAKLADVSNASTKVGKPPPCIRPDRQVEFGGVPHGKWPPPRHDEDSITVDRMRDDIDGPAHRFTIRLGDTVEVFICHDKLDVGEVIGISQTNEEVCVQFQDDTEPMWFPTDAIYPATLASYQDTRRDVDGAP